MLGHASFIRRHFVCYPHRWLSVNGRDRKSTSPFRQFKLRSEHVVKYTKYRNIFTTHGDPMEMKIILMMSPTSFLELIFAEISSIKRNKKEQWMAFDDTNSMNYIRSVNTQWVALSRHKFKDSFIHVGKALPSKLALTPCDAIYDPASDKKEITLIFMMWMWPYE